MPNLPKPPSTPTARRAGMAAFRAQVLASSEAALRLNAQGKLPMKTADKQLISDSIATIKAMQKKAGEANHG